MNCKYCRANCTGAKHDREIALCLGYDPPKTNADRIRAMTDEELAKVLRRPCDIVDHIPTEWCNGRNCGYRCALDWLKEEVADKEGSE